MADMEEFFFSWKEFRRLTSASSTGLPPDIKLVKAQYLKEKGANSPLLPRQMLELEKDDPFWKPEELFDVSGAPIVPMMVSVSHMWMSQVHPDPNGFMLKSLLLALDLLNEDNVAIFIDWCSLYQNIRTLQEEEAYKRSLCRMDVVYGHPEIHKWLMTKVPLSVATAPYADRGWTTFESAMSTMVLYEGTVLDLGQLVASDSVKGDYPQLVRKYEVQQLPPKTPKYFENLIDGKKFTFECDKQVVIASYEKAFHALWGTSEKLSYVSASWGLSEVKDLVDAINALEKPTVRHLELSKNKLDDDCMAELAKVLPRCQQLQTLNVGHNQFGDAGAGALAQQLTQCGLLRELQMDNTQMTDQGLVALGKVIQQGKHLRKVNLAGTDCGKAGLVMLAASVKACASLENLRLTANGGTPLDAEIKKLQDIWMEAGKPAHRLFLES